MVSRVWHKREHPHALQGHNNSRQHCPLHGFRRNSYPDPGSGRQFLQGRLSGRPDLLPRPVRRSDSAGGAYRAAPAGLHQWRFSGFHSAAAAWKETGFSAAISHSG